MREKGFFGSLGSPPEVPFGGWGSVRRRPRQFPLIMNRLRVRIVFCKQGDLRWIGHRDLARLWERLFRRAGIRLAHSQGFHPKPKMSFPLALAVGIEGLQEVMEVELTEPWTPEQVREKLTAVAPSGLEIVHLECLAPGAPKARVRAVSYRMAVPADRYAQLAERIAAWSGGSKAETLQGPVSGNSLLPQALEAIRLEEGRLEFTLRVLPEGLPNGREVLAALQLADLEPHGAVLIRSRVELEASS